MSGLSLSSATMLNNEVAIPRLGLGVFRAGAGAATIDAVRTALEVGYRHVDTAHIYGNEREVGEGIRQSDVPREEIFVTTKLWNDDHGYDATLRAYDASAAALGLDYVDLYLMHWPVPGRRLDSWRAMEKIYEEGRCRAIGVSNFMPHHLDELLGEATVTPAVNQVEAHPFLQQRELRSYCPEHGIALEAYSPLTKGQRLSHPAVIEVADETGRTPAQVLLRWSLQSGFVVLAKSANPSRIRENASLYDFQLSDEQVAKLDGLEEGLHTAWDPTTAP